MKQWDEPDLGDVVGAIEFAAIRIMALIIQQRWTNTPFDECLYEARETFYQQPRRRDETKS